jgi:hypothetical protein
MGIFLQLFKKKNTVCNFKYKNAQEYIIVECLFFFFFTNRKKQKNETPSGHLMAVYLQKRQTIPGRHSSGVSKILMISSSNLTNVCKKKKE